MTADGVDLQAAFAGAMGQLLGPDFPDALGLAVSGGGDSMAMLTLAHNWTRDYGVTLRVVTVDHGLRPDSAKEAALVARTCAELGHAHDIVVWSGWDGVGNLQDAARQARLGLINAWRGDLRHILMAHTADDQAETFLLRLARGSGVDGLAAMAPKRFVPDRTERALDNGFWVVRPLLDMRRADLRHYLKVLKGEWVDDPSNDDPRFDRVRIRQAMAGLDNLGLSVARLSETTARMARARDALRARAQEVAAEAVQHAHADLLISRDALDRAEQETVLRLLAAMLQYVSSSVYRPRLSALEDMAARVLSGGTASLHGCLIRAERNMLRVCREYAAIRASEAAIGEIWDGRVRLSGVGLSGLRVRALGEAGAARLPQRPEGLPYQSLIAQPAVFDGDRLVAFAPAKFGPAHHVDACAGQGDFHAFLLSH